MAATARRWVATLDPVSHFHRLFDYIPGVHFFTKNRDGRLIFASRDLLRRYRMSDETEFVGLTDHDINPGSMARSYVRDDQRLLAGKARLVERIELWWDPQGMPDWYLVTKLSLTDTAGHIAGVMGILRRPEESERHLPVFATVARAVEIMRRDFAKPLLIADVATCCGQSLRQLQRRFREAFGISPQEFLLKTRVQAAAQMLDETMHTAAEIALRCGFVDASSFTQQFRRRTGVTPTAYRHRGLTGERFPAQPHSTTSAQGNRRTRTSLK